MANEWWGRILQIEEDDPTYGAEYGVPSNRFIARELLHAAMIRVARGAYTVAQFRTAFGIPASGSERTEFDSLVTAAQAAADGLLAAAADINAILTLWEIEDQHSVPQHQTPAQIVARLLEIGNP